ncbi:MAG: glycosyltransferase [Bacteroidota bacterium]
MPTKHAILKDLRVYQSEGRPEEVFSIIIPSWNNRPYLQLCIERLLKHSHFPHQIIVHLNEAKDDSLDWLHRYPQIDYTYSPSNIGICYALNVARRLVRTPYVCYFNDDMVALPHWDRYLYEEVQRIGHEAFILSATMIEPFDTGNPCVLVADYGDTLSTFKETALLDAYAQLEKTDWQGSTWPPIVLPLSLWDLVGGMSAEFSPGMYSDPDLSMKLWQAGVRLFKGIGKSRVYHFGSKSTRRGKMNKGKRQFLQKWGMSSGDFTRQILRRGQPFDGPLSSISLSPMQRLKNKTKSIWNALGPSH